MLRARVPRHVPHTHTQVALRQRAGGPRAAPRPELVAWCHGWRGNSQGAPAARQLAPWRPTTRSNTLRLALCSASDPASQRFDWRHAAMRLRAPPACGSRNRPHDRRHPKLAQCHLRLVRWRRREAPPSQSDSRHGAPQRLLHGHPATNAPLCQTPYAWPRGCAKLRDPPFATTSLMHARLVQWWRMDRPHCDAREILILSTSIPD